MVIMAAATMGSLWSQVGPSVATLMFIWTLYQNYFPEQLRAYLISRGHKICSFFYPYIQITFHEFEADELFGRSKLFVAIERYLSYNSSTNAKRLVAKGIRDSSQSVVLTMDFHEEVTDVFDGIKVWWSSNQQQQLNNSKEKDKERRFFKLTFREKNRVIITESYLTHVSEEGEAIAMRDRKQKLYTNNHREDWRWYSYTPKWSRVIFNHPSNFDTLAMEPNKKQGIVNELLNFSKSKDYYAKIGKAWKRGYLLYGPPGTGKSSMIAAMANLLHYNVYDLELTTVKDNNELRKLLIETSRKSIIVIEDIDCSLDLTLQRKKNKKKEGKEEEKDGECPIKKKAKKKEKGCEVTLSGLLNVIDGLWSAIGEEKIIVFTTNHIDNLDPALIRRGRMDNHIELSYCCFEAFKVLAKNYLDIESHELFQEIRHLLEETKTTHADIAENLMPKSAKEEVDTCLQRLIKSLQAAKEKEKRIMAAKEEEEEEEESGDEEDIENGEEIESN